MKRESSCAGKTLAGVLKKLTALSRFQKKNAFFQGKYLVVAKEKEVKIC